MKRKKTHGRHMKEQIQDFIVLHRKALLSLGFIGLFTGLFSILPPIAATLSASLIALGSYIIYERKRRLFWEQSLNFKMLNLSKQQDTLSKDVSAKIKSDPQKPQVFSAPHERRPLTRNSRRYNQIVCSEDIIMEDADRDIRAPQPLKASNSNQHKSLPPALKPVNASASMRFQDILAGKARQAQLRPAAYDQTTNQPAGLYYSPSLIKEFLENALKQKNLQIQKNPVMEMPQRKAKYYILSAAVPTYAHHTLSDKDYETIAAQNNLSGKLAALILEQALSEISAGETARYIMPISEEILQSSAFINTLFSHYKSAPQHVNQMVFSLPYNQFSALKAQTIQVMQAIARLKCSFMLSDIKNSALNTARLHQLNIRMLAIPAQFVAQKIRTPEGFREIVDTRRALESESFHVMVSDISTETALQDFQTFAPRYAAGSCFTPRSIATAASR